MGRGFVGGESHNIADGLVSIGPEPGYLRLEYAAIFKAFDVNATTKHFREVDRLNMHHLKQIIFSKLAGDDIELSPAVCRTSNRITPAT